jgi:hypothetical protein
MVAGCELLLPFFFFFFPFGSMGEEHPVLEIFLLSFTFSDNTVNLTIFLTRELKMKPLHTG